MEKYFLDKRILVNGRKSHIYLDNFIDLSDYILEVIGVYIAANPYPDYTFQNGLTESPLLTAEWGGTLLHDTTINGQNLYDVHFNNIDEFSVTNTANGFKLGIGNHSGHSSANPPMAGLYRSYNTYYRVGHYIVTKATQSQAISSYEYINSLDNSSRITMTNHSSTALDSFVTEDDGLGFIETSGIKILKNQLSLSSITTGGGGLGEGIKLQIDDNKGIQFFGTGYFYYFPETVGSVGQTLTTDGIDQLSWTTPTPQVHKCEVLYFTDNPLNTTYSAFGIGDIELATYSMPANTLSSNGSYIEIDLQLQITGLGAFISESPQFQIDFRGLGSSIIFQHLNGVSYIQTIKARIYRVSNTTHYSTGTSEIFDPITFQTTTNYINNVSGLVTFSNIITFDLNLILNATSDHTVELKHFTITKYIK